MRILVSFWFGSILLLGACNAYEPDLGAAPFLCGPPEQNPRCPDGYACTPGMGSGAMDVCLKMGGTIPPDGTPGNCLDDSPLEPNNDTQHAWVTPVDTTKTFPLAGLAICPAGDKDTYSITIRVMSENLEAIVEWEAEGAALQGAILNSGGVPIANASAVSGTTNKIRAYTANLPTGTYFVQVYGPASGALTTNNYKLNINVT